MLVDQLFSIRDFAPEECQLAFLITEVLFLTMLQVSTPYPSEAPPLFRLVFVQRHCDIHQYIVCVA